MKRESLKPKSSDELAKLLEIKQEALRQFRFDVAGSRVKHVRAGRLLRREIARAKTEQTARVHGQ